MLKVKLTPIEQNQFKDYLCSDARDKTKGFGNPMTSLR